LVYSPTLLRNFSMMVIDDLGLSLRKYALHTFSNSL